VAIRQITTVAARAAPDRAGANRTISGFRDLTELSQALASHQPDHDESAAGGGG